MELLGYLLLVMAMLAVLSVPKVLVDVAWQKGGKWLTVAWVVNGICIVIVAFAGLYALIIGLTKFWDEDWKVGLLAAGALAFVVYFYISMDEAKRKTELTPKV